MDQSSETPEFDPDKNSMDELGMDITSELELGTIELNAPVQLISESYQKDMAKQVADEIKLVNKKRFVCNVSKVKELFTCNM